MPTKIFFEKVLSWLLHHANREGRNENFYAIKNRLLSKYGKHIGYDVQFIEGKKCYSCEGTGEHKKYDYHGRVYDVDACYRCYDGWYKRPTWNILQKVQFGKFIFHQPYQRAYKKPTDIATAIIEGYIEHNRSKHGKLALSVLFLIYERGYVKRWYKETGIGWRCYWYLPRNYIHNIIHIIKHRRNSYPFIKKDKQPIYNHWQTTDDLPF